MRATRSTHTSFSLIGNAQFSGTAGQRRAVIGASGATTSICGDVNGDAVADVVLLLTGSHLLNPSDFYL